MRPPQWLGDLLDREPARRQFTTAGRFVTAARRRFARTTIIRRLKRADDAERRAAAIALSGPGLSFSGRDLRWAVELPGEWAVPELYALLTAAGRREFCYGDEVLLESIVDLVSEVDPEERTPLWRPLSHVLRALSGSDIDARGPARQRSEDYRRDDPPADPVRTAPPSPGA